MLGMVVENMICNLAMYQALADPRKSVELREFVQGIVHDETVSLIRERNEVIQMQDERIAVLRAEVDRLVCERLESAVQQCAEVQAIYQQHCAEMKELHEQHSAEIKTLRRELNDISRGA
jgi:hypothetical protein